MPLFYYIKDEWPFTKSSLDVSVCRNLKDSVKSNTHIFINGHLCVWNQSLCIKSEISKCTQTEYHHCIINTLDRELQVHKTQPNVLIVSTIKTTTITLNTTAVHWLWCHTEYSQLSSSEESFSDWLKMSGISRKPKMNITKITGLCRLKVRTRFKIFLFYIPSDTGKLYPCRKAMYRHSDKNTRQSGGLQVKSVRCRSLWTQNSFLSWLSVTHYRYIVLFEMQNHSAHYRPSYPQKEMIGNVNPQPGDKDILSPWVNCTSIIHLQCILKPFSIIFHSVHFLSAVLVWKW